MSTLPIINYTARDSVGNILAGVTVAVLSGTLASVTTSTQPGSPLATIYQSSTSPSVADPTGATQGPNPTTTDGLGNLSFAVTPGFYVLQIYGPGINGQQFVQVVAGGVSFVNPMTTEGDMIYGGTSGTSTRLPAGTTGQVPTVQSNGTVAFASLPSPNISINNQTVSSYTLQLSDNTALVRMNNSGSNTVTVPLNASVAFPIGASITVRQVGTGQTTIVATSGVTITTPSSLALRVQYASVQLVQVSTDTWDLIGDTQ